MAALCAFIAVAPAECMMQSALLAVLRKKPLLPPVDCKPAVPLSGGLLVNVLSSSCTGFLSFDSRVAGHRAAWTVSLQYAATLLS